MQRYQNVLQRWLQRPLLVLLLVVPLVVLGGVAYRSVGTGFMPKMDEGGFILDYLSKPGTSLAETDRLLRQVEAIIRANPDVDTYSRRTGLQLGGGLTEANQGDFFVRLKSGTRPATEEVMNEIRSAGRAEGAGPGDRAVAADGRPDRRPDGGAAADRDQAVRRRRDAARRHRAQGRRRDRQDQRRGRRAQRHQPGRRRADRAGRPGEGRAGRARPGQRHRPGGGGDRRHGRRAAARGEQDGRRARAAAGSMRTDGWNRLPRCRSAPATATCSRCRGWPR